MIENYMKSLDKWKDDVWADLEQGRIRWKGQPSPRGSAWRSAVWRACGFCVEFGECSDCPLYPRHCDCNIDRCVESNNTMGKLRTLWMNGEEKKFRALQLTFLRAIYAHKGKF